MGVILTGSMSWTLWCAWQEARREIKRGREGGREGREGKQKNYTYTKNTPDLPPQTKNRCQALLEKIKYDLIIARGDESFDVRYNLDLAHADDLPINSLGRRVRYVLPPSLPSPSLINPNCFDLFPLISFPPSFPPSLPFPQDPTLFHQRVPPALPPERHAFPARKRRGREGGREGGRAE